MRTGASTSHIRFPVVLHPRIKYNVSIQSPVGKYQCKHCCIFPKAKVKMFHIKIKYMDVILSYPRKLRTIKNEWLQLYQVTQKHLKYNRSECTQRCPLILCSTSPGQKSINKRKQEHQKGTEVGAMLKAAYKLTSQALLATFLIQLKPSCLGMVPPTVGRPSMSITH